MIPITSSAGWVLLYWLCRRTISPLLITASGSPVQVDIFSTLCTSVGSRVATERQTEAPPPVLTRHGPLHDANRGGLVWQVRPLDRIRHAVGGPGDAGRMGAEPHGSSWPPSSDRSPGFAWAGCTAPPAHDVEPARLST